MGASDASKRRGRGRARSRWLAGVCPCGGGGCAAGGGCSCLKHPPLFFPFSPPFERGFQSPRRGFVRSFFERGKAAGLSTVALQSFFNGAKASKKRGAV